LRVGKQVDLDKTSKILIAEFRAGAIGNITLEKPGMMAQELNALALTKERKAEKKTNRKQKWKASR
jgi:ribosome biogenesis GTPase A